ncbi:MAG: hypothetical protein N2578_10450, partial [Bdellovibrionaceae bacterium]|nr:hypothetical protein [Pseudobdellovibrionaceae bacterium]
MKLTASLPFVFALVLTLPPVSGASALAQSAAKIKMNEKEMREYMLEISRQLGVSCRECHSLANFRDGSLPTYQVALE